MEELTENEKLILGELAIIYPDDERYCMNFRGLSKKTGLVFEGIRHAARGLKAKGYAEYVRPVWNVDEGCPMGSGYRATQAGFERWKELGEPHSGAV